MSLRRLSQFAARAAIAVAASAASAASAPVLAQPQEPITLNFRDAEIDSVVGAFGHLLNRTFVVDPRVRGKITLETPRPVNRARAFDLLKTVLRQQGFAVIDDGPLVKVVPEADAKLQSGPVEAGRVPSRTGDQIITQVFNLNHESATNLIPILRPLVSPNNTVTAFPNNNSLVITDYAANLNRLSRIIAALDNPRAGNDVEIVPVKNAVASDIAMAVSRLLDDTARGGAQGGGGGGAPGAAIDPGQRVTVLADPRTNAVLLRTQSAAKMVLAKNLVERLDVPASSEQANMRVVYLRNAEAVRLVEVLRGVLSGGEGGYGGMGGYGGGGYGGGYGGGGYGGFGGTGGLGGSQQSRFGQSGSAFSNQQSMFGGTGSSSSGAFGSSGSAFGQGMGGSSFQQGQQMTGPVTVNAGGAVIAADPSTNSLIITAPEPIYRNVRAVIDKLDSRRAQVYIESLIVEVNADTAAEIGIQWQFLNAPGAGGGNQWIGGTNLPPRDGGSNIIDATANILGIGTGLNIGLVRGSTMIGADGTETSVVNLGLLARALQTKTGANIKATPNLLTLDNEEARIIIGQNVPFVTGQYTGVAGTAVANPFQTIERKDVGTSLRVRPQVSEGGSVKMQIFQEVSNVVDSSLAAGLITNRRAIESNVIVDDGQVVVLGGLIQDSVEGTVSKVPILGDIPILGRLFRYDSRTHQKTNLLVFLRPIVIRDAGGAWDVTANRYDYIRALSNDAQLERFAPLPNMQSPNFEPLPARPGTPGAPQPPREPQNLAPGSTQMLNRGDVRPYGQIPTTETTPRPAPQPPPPGTDPLLPDASPTFDLREGQGVQLPTGPGGGQPAPGQPGGNPPGAGQAPAPADPPRTPPRTAPGPLIEPPAVQMPSSGQGPAQPPRVQQPRGPSPQGQPPQAQPPVPRAPAPRPAPARPPAPATPDIYNGA